MAVHATLNDPETVRDFSLLVRSRSALFLVDTVEYARLEAVLRAVAEQERVPFRIWDAHHGLRVDGLADPVPDTASPRRALERVLGQGPALYHFPGLASSFEEAPVRALLRDIALRWQERGGAVVVSGADMRVPPEIDGLFTHFELAPPSPAQLRAFVTAVLRDLATRMPVRVDLDADETERLLRLLQGLPLTDVRKCVTRAVVEKGVLDPRDFEKVLDLKRDAVERTGVLEFFAADQAMKDVAGLSALKTWLRKRRAAFTDPDSAKKFGLSPPRGLLLLGVQGCGKSLSAKAAASEWGLPLLRLDVAGLYQKYFGESEKNLKRALKAAEAMAPVVLWIDEIEKAFASTTDQDSGTSQRVFGSFLTWMNEKRDTVFVVATANDVSRLPPELLRKGRFDEIFFVDLPAHDARKQIFGIHLSKRGWQPGAFDLDLLAARAEGFSGAEIEQAVVSALYSAFGGEGTLTNEALLEEIATTRPLSLTMKEKIESLRAWARDRTVSADGPQAPEPGSSEPGTSEPGKPDPA